MQPCERVDLEFVDNAPFRFVSTVDLAITPPEQLFEVLGDAESWPRWASVITEVTWTSPPEPRGVGTTRTVKMRGGIVGAEEFLAWELLAHGFFASMRRRREVSRRSRRTTAWCAPPGGAVT